MSTVATRSLPARADAAPLVRVATTAITVLVAASALAFGAVYPWAYWPVAALAAGIGVVGLTTATPATRSGLSSLAVAFAICAGAIAAQLAPLSPEALAAVSPAASGILRDCDPGFAAADGVHPISIAPVFTSTALLLFAALALFTIGSASLFGALGARRTVRRIIAVAMVLVVIALVQKPFYAGYVYGFWAPSDPAATPFGPFVNRNHFAGWMIMAIPLAVGLLCGAVAHATTGAKATLRNRLLWFTSPAASRAVVYATAAAAMIVAVPLTLSRSGMLSTVFGLTVMAALAATRRSGAGRHAAILAFIAAAAIGAAVFVGIDTISARFAQAEWTSLDGRIGPWSDAWTVARMYPLAGTGLNTYGVSALFYQQHDLVHHYAQAHNDYLQLAAEGGLLVCVPIAVCVLVFGWTARRRLKTETSTRTWWLRAGALTGMLSMAIQEVFEFSLQMPANALLFAVLAAIAIHQTPVRKTGGPEGDRRT